MAFADNPNDADDAIQDLVESIAQEIFRTPMEERKEAMAAISRSLKEVFDIAHASDANDNGHSRQDGGGLAAALNARISTRVIELDSAFDAFGQIKRP